MSDGTAWCGRGEEGKQLEVTAAADLRASMRTESRHSESRKKMKKKQHRRQDNPWKAGAGASSPLHFSPFSCLLTPYSVRRASSSSNAAHGHHAHAHAHAHTEYMLSILSILRSPYLRRIPMLMPPSLPSLAECTLLLGTLLCRSGWPHRPMSSPVCRVP